MPLMTGGKAVVECLKAHDVDTIFGIISTHTMHIYDALYHEQPNIRFIGGRHEHALGFMADGYSRVTGKPGIMFTSGGPRRADSMGSMGEAYHASSKLLQVTANAEKTSSTPARAPSTRPRTSSACSAPSPAGTPSSTTSKPCPTTSSKPSSASNPADPVPSNSKSPPTSSTNRPISKSSRPANRPSLPPTPSPSKTP